MWNMYHDSMWVQSFPLFLYLHSLKLSEFLKCSSFDYTYLIVLQMPVGEKKNFIIQSTPAIQLQLTLISLPEWLKWQLKED